MVHAYRARDSGRRGGAGRNVCGDAEVRADGPSHQAEFVAIGPGAQLLRAQWNVGGERVVVHARRSQRPALKLLENAGGCQRPCEFQLRQRSQRHGVQADPLAEDVVFGAADVIVPGFSQAERIGQFVRCLARFAQREVRLAEQ